MNDDDLRAVLASPVLRLHLATSLVDRVADTTLRAAHGFGIATFQLLLVIRALEPASQRRVADQLGVSRASVTQSLARASADGDVTVEPDPDDARANRVRLTATGRRRLEAAWRTLDTADDGVEHGVDLAALGAQLERVIDNARAVLGGLR